jgi:hypothetical protein
MQDLSAIVRPANEFIFYYCIYQGLERKQTFIKLNKQPANVAEIKMVLTEGQNISAQGKS